jgi:glutathione S-transferase
MPSRASNRKEHDVYRLYYSPGACSMSVHIVLEEIGEPHEVELVSSKPGGRA